MPPSNRSEAPFNVTERKVKCRRRKTFSSRKKPRAPKEVEEPWWPIRRIAKESQTHYQVEWEGRDPTTGRAWPPDWVTKDKVALDSIQEWEDAKGSPFTGAEQKHGLLNERSEQASRPRRQIGTGKVEILSRVEIPTKFIAETQQVLHNSPRRELTQESFSGPFSVSSSQESLRIATNSLRKVQAKLPENLERTVIADTKNSANRSLLLSGTSKSLLKIINQNYTSQETNSEKTAWQKPLVTGRDSIVTNTEDHSVLEYSTRSFSPSNVSSTHCVATQTLEPCAQVSAVGLDPVSSSKSESSPIYRLCFRKPIENTENFDSHPVSNIQESERVSDENCSSSLGSIREDEVEGYHSSAENSWLDKIAKNRGSVFNSIEKLPTSSPVVEDSIQSYDKLRAGSQNRESPLTAHSVNASGSVESLPDDSRNNKSQSIQELRAKGKAPTLNAVVVSNYEDSQLDSGIATETYFVSSSVSRGSRPIAREKKSFLSVKESGFVSNHLLQAQPEASVETQTKVISPSIGKETSSIDRPPSISVKESLSVNMPPFPHTPSETPPSSATTSPDLRSIAPISIDSGSSQVAVKPDTLRTEVAATSQLSTSVSATAILNDMQHQPSLTPSQNTIQSSNNEFGPISSSPIVQNTNVYNETDEAVEKLASATTLSTAHKSETSISESDEMLGQLRQYMIMNPRGPDDNVSIRKFIFHLTLPPTPETKNQYNHAIDKDYDLILDFISDPAPNPKQESPIGPVTERVLDILTHIDLDNDDTWTEREIEPEAKVRWDVTVSSKFACLKGLIDVLGEQKIPLHIVIFVKGGRTTNILQTFLTGAMVTYAGPTTAERWPSVDMDAKDLSPATVTIVNTSLNSNQIAVHNADLILGFDETFDLDNPSVEAVYKRASRKYSCFPIVVFVVPYTIDHLKRAFGRCPEHMLWENTLRLHKSHYKKHIPYSAEAIGYRIPSMFFDGDHGPSDALVPAETLDLVSRLRQEQMLSGGASRETTPGVKRPLEDDSPNDLPPDAKKARTSPSSPNTESESTDAVMELDIEDQESENSREPSPIEVMIPDAVMLEITGLRDKVVRLEQAAVEDEAAHGSLQSRFEEQYKELAATRAKLREQTTALASRDAKIESLAEINKNLKKMYEETRRQLQEASQALSTGSKPELSEYAMTVTQAQEAEALRDKLTKEKESSEFFREQYQNASAAAARNASRLLDLEKENSGLRDRTSGVREKVHSLYQGNALKQALGALDRTRQEKDSMSRQVGHLQKQLEELKEREEQRVKLAGMAASTRASSLPPGTAPRSRPAGNSAKALGLPGSSLRNALANVLDSEAGDAGSMSMTARAGTSVSTSRISSRQASRQGSRQSSPMPSAGRRSGRG